MYFGSQPHADYINIYHHKIEIGYFIDCFMRLGNKDKCLNFLGLGEVPTILGGVIKILKNRSFVLINYFICLAIQSLALE